MLTKKKKIYGGFDEIKGIGRENGEKTKFENFSSKKIHTIFDGKKEIISVLIKL